MKRRLFQLISVGCLGVVLAAACPVWAMASAGGDDTGIEDAAEDPEFFDFADGDEDSQEEETVTDEEPADDETVLIAEDDTAQGESNAVYADAGGDVLVDDAWLLSNSEAEDLEAFLKEISDRHNMDVAVVTKDGLGGRNIMEFADDYYDYEGYRPNGIMLVLDMDQRDYWITTTGECINIFNDYDIEELGDEFVPYLSAGEYYEAFHRFGELCEEEIIAYENGTDNYYDTDEDYQGDVAPWEDESSSRSSEPAVGVMAAGSGVIGLLVAAIVTGVMRSKLKSVHYQQAAGAYEIPGSFHLTAHRDTFLYRHVDRVAKPKEENRSSGGSHGGGGSIHIGGSGAPHGGGGGKF